ncbi:hypothetical protein BG004_007510, partial [Podila humilis]
MSHSRLHPALSKGPAKTLKHRVCHWEHGKQLATRFDTSCPTALTTQQTKDLTATPARKKAKTEAKRGASDTASLFQKIFADREPGKRKIRTKSVHEIPIDLGVDEDDSDFEDSKLNSDNEDEDMILPDDGTSEDEDKPSQGASFGDEQNLMATLWQW